MTVRTNRIAAFLLTVAVSFSLGLGVASPANAGTVFTAPQEVEGAPVVPEQSVEYRGQLFFSGDSLEEWPLGKLYSFDGTSFTLIDPLYGNVTNLRVINDVLYFSAKLAGSWFVVAYDGTSLSQTGIASTFSSIEFIGYDTGILAIAQSGPDDYALQYLVAGSVRNLETFDYASGLANFEGLAYFVVLPTGAPDYEMYRTDGVLVEADVTDPGSTLFVWKNTLYMGKMGTNWTFTKVLPDMTTVTASAPAIEFVFHFIDGGDVMYFTGDRALKRYVYAYDGTFARELPAGPAVGDLKMFDGHLFATSLGTSVSVCSLDVSVQCESDVVDVYYFDGTSWVLSASARSSLGGLIAFQNRLYFQDGAKWMFIEPASLADTGLNPAPTAWATAILVMSGIAMVAIRRRVRAESTD